MNCASCGASNQADAVFCEECGASFGRECPSCGTSCSPRAKFCRKCRAPLGGEAVARKSERDPRSYTPKHLAEKILTSRSALEGERKQVTVLFADVKGSMDLSESIDPEEWHKIMDRFFAILSEGVHRFEGTINQYTGDGIMALFGAPIAHEDHAARACYAALALQDDLRRYANELRLAKGINFSVRMGLNSGEVVVGQIGDDLRMDYTALGHTASLGARMEQIAEPGKAYLTEHTAKLVEGLIKLEDLGKLTVKGVKEPLNVYELQGIGRLRAKIEVSRARGFSKFVGRTNEMSILETALERAIGGQGQVVGVVGEPGVGKSRLCIEFVERCRARGIYVNEAHCPPHGKVLPFVPILELWRSYFRIVERDSPDEARQKIAGALLLLGEEFREMLPIVFEFLGVGDPARPAPLIDGAARQRALFGFLRRHTQALAEREPFVVLIDDLHWIDPASDAFVAQFVEAIEGRPVLFVANFRPQYEGVWLRKSYYQQLPLLPLGTDATEALLDDLLGRDSALKPLRRKIVDRTRGNPFFVEEVVQALLESGSLGGMKGSLRLIHPVDSLEIPSTVQVVLASRIDRLPEREKRLLGIAAVIGRIVPAEVLRRVAGRPDDDVAFSLAKLAETELLYEAAIYPRAEYAFKHPLTQEVAYRSQLAERRRHVHLEVACAIQAIEAGRLDETAAVIAHHYEQAGEALDAAHWHERAARWTQKSDLAEALVHWKAVRRLACDVAESPDIAALALAACGRILSIGWHHGLSDAEAKRVFDEGRILAERIGDLRSLAHLIASYGGIVGTAAGTCDCDASVDKNLQALRIAQEIGDCDFQAGIVGFALVSHFFAGRIREGLALCDSGIIEISADRIIGPEVAGFYPDVALVSMRWIFLLYAGRMKETLIEWERAKRLALERQDPVYVSVNNAGVAWISEVLGNCDASVLAHGRAAVESAERVGYSHGVYYGWEAIGIGRSIRGEWAESRAALERALDVSREERVGGACEARALAHLARAELGLGDVDRARATIEAAVCAGQEHHTRVFEIQAHLERARILREIDGPGGIEKASLSLGAAEQLIEETGAESLRPQVHEERSRLAHLRGDSAARDRELAEAHRLYVAIGAVGHAERLSKEIAQ